MASHFFQESLFAMGPMIQILEEVPSDKVTEAYVIAERLESAEETAAKNRQMILSLDKKVHESNGSYSQKEEEQ